MRPTDSAAAAREAARGIDGRFGECSRPKATMPTSLLEEPPRPVARTLADLEAAGFVTDEWKRWQQGGCGDYAVALISRHPHLRLGVLGRSDTGDPTDGWVETHFFAHDDEFAYDSAGRHALPYRGIVLPGEANDCDVVELDQEPDWYGLADEADPDEVQAALAHATRNGIGPGAAA